MNSEQFGIMPLKVKILTASRAEYGLLKPLIKEIDSSKDFRLELMVMGTHLSEEFGNTIEEIQKDGFEISYKLETIQEGDKRKDMSIYMAQTIKEVTKVFENSETDILVLLGDRSEILAAAIAASCMNIPIAHLHGGEYSGAVDEPFRDAISKLSHIHLPPTNKSRQKLIDIGESPERITVVGSPGLVKLKEKIDRESVKERFDIDTEMPLALVVQHPVTTEDQNSGERMEITLQTLKECQLQSIIIYPNVDAGGREIIRVIDEYVEKQENMQAVKNLPRSEYLGLMDHADLMIGNSSSGIIEAPELNTPYINIGKRQRGRERSSNVINVDHKKTDIIEAIKKTINDKKFLEKVKESSSPHYMENSHKKAAEALKKLEKNKELIQK